MLFLLVVVAFYLICYVIGYGIELYYNWDLRHIGLWVLVTRPVGGLVCLLALAVVVMLFMLAYAIG